MDNSFYKFITMTNKEKVEKIQELTEAIIYLKQNPQVNSKETIQNLQKEIDRLLHEKYN